MSAERPSLFPAFLKLEGKRCLLAGGGPVAESKLEGLLRSGARITLVSPALTPRLAEQAACGGVLWKARGFETSDLDGVFLVVAATGDAQANELIFREADRRSILCNAVDEPEHCHFYYSAVVERGTLQIAISTGGLSPSLAQRLREELEVQFGPEYEQYAEWLGRIRTSLMHRGIDFETRRRVLRRVASRDVFEQLQAAQKRKPCRRGFTA
jgi:precorrin-2 dehydrogenase/sirohydrochlorin ferrochelatase